MAPLDFTKLNTGPSANVIVDPRRLFATLNRNSRFKRPSDNQGEVLDAWLEVRKQRDVTLKMNTGAGKTLVGLLILQSCLNEAVGPAVYITPDPYLSAQVIAEAKALGIKVTDDEKSSDFLSYKAILVATIKKLCNGKSTFGVDQIKIKLGSVVIDDAHACLATVQDQFRISFEADHAVYKRLLKLFGDSLSQQSATFTSRLKQGDPTVCVAVPFWSWKAHIPEIATTLLQHADEKSLAFTLPLLIDALDLCQCVLSGYRVEIAPRCIPIQVLPSFDEAKRRVYMTATLADDGQLITNFRADAKAITDPVRPKGAGGMGDRMILVPQHINPKITDEEIRSFASSLSRSYNVTVIVPSKRRLEPWLPFAQQVLNAENIHDGVEKLKSGIHVGLSVLLNKYDGVDLPDSACRILIIDGLPEYSSLADRIEANALEGTEAYLARQVQRIEQGMGRGVRSSEDYCVVLLVGSGLVEKLDKPEAKAKFTSATLAQMELGESVTAQLAGSSLNDLLPTLEYCLKQDAGWVSASRTALANAPDEGSVIVNPSVLHVREAFDAGRLRLWQKSREAMQQAVNGTLEPKMRGYLMQQLAEYVYHQQPAEAQEIQLSAVMQNSRVLRPIEGIAYNKLTSGVMNQGALAVEFMRQFQTGNELLIWINSLIEALVWDEEATERFEKGIQQLGEFLGFGSQRPEADYGIGPDNLWSLGDLKFAIIECKSGASSPMVSKSDSNQLLGSMQWFSQKYVGVDATAVMIHPSPVFEKQSTPTAGTRVIDAQHLSALKTGLSSYGAALAKGVVRSTSSSVAALLKQFNFDRMNIVFFYSEAARMERK